MLLRPDKGVLVNYLFIRNIPLKSVFVPLVCANNEYTRHCCIKFLELSQDMLFLDSSVVFEISRQGAAKIYFI